MFWRLFIPNAAVLLAAGIVLMVEPANGRVVALVGGLTILLAVNMLLMRRAFAPLVRLTGLMHAIDPLEPGRRLPVLGPRSEVTQLAEAFNAMLDRLETERRESGYRALAAQEQERRRVAVELHDEVGQQLTALLLALDRLGRRVPEELHDEFAANTAVARGTLDDVREIARRLRPEVLDDLGLVPALRNLCDRLSASTGLTIRRSLPERLEGLSAEVELVIYRVAQESLTNVVRHAGAGEARVSVAVADGVVELTVSDDGAGVPARQAWSSSGGIRGMRERALLVGARLELEASGAGTQIRLRVPAGTAAERPRG